MSSFILSSISPNLTFYTPDVFQTGAIITAVSIVLFVLSSIYLTALLVRPSKHTPRVIAIQAAILAFFALWLFAALVPYTHFFRTRSANVTATIGSVPINSGLVAALENEFGLTPVYNRLGYCECR